MPTSRASRILSLLATASLASSCQILLVMTTMSASAVTPRLMSRHALMAALHRYSSVVAYSTYANAVGPSAAVWLSFGVIDDSLMRTDGVLACSCLLFCHTSPQQSADSRATHARPILVRLNICQSTCRCHYMAQGLTTFAANGFLVTPMSRHRLSRKANTVCSFLLSLRKRLQPQ